MAGVLISAAVIYSNGPSGPANIGDISTEPKVVSVSTDDDAFLGDKDAPIVVIEFSDLQCPFCRSFWRDTLPLIKSEYIDTGKVKFVYRDFPLDFHPGAMPAAQATECAEEQGKFWEMHDKIFSEQGKQGDGTISFGVDDLEKWASEIGLNAGDFNSCLDSQKYAEEVKKDINDGRLAGLNGTPSFLIFEGENNIMVDSALVSQKLAQREYIIRFEEGSVVVGAQPFSVFKAIIDEELAK